MLCVLSSIGLILFVIFSSFIKPIVIRVFHCPQNSEPNGRIRTDSSIERIPNHCAACTSRSQWFPCFRRFDVKPFRNLSPLPFL